MAVAKLSELLSSGRFPLQSKFPPERTLASQLGLSRSALREGLELLEAEGRIWRHVGKGTFIGNRPVEETATLSVITAQTSPSEVLEIRHLIEPLLARLAALRATESDIRHMEHLLEKSEAARDAKTWELWDGRLHRMVAEAAHNGLFLSLFDAFNAIRTQTTWGRLREAALTDERRETYCRHHRAYVTAIAERDPDRAEALMRQHVAAVRDGLLRTDSVKPKEAP